MVFHKIIDRKNMHSGATITTFIRELDLSNFRITNIRIFYYFNANMFVIFFIKHFLYNNI